MVNFLNQLEDPQLNHEEFFEVLRDFRKGGLRPENYTQFLEIVKSLPPINQRQREDYNKFGTLGLKDVSQEEFPVILKEVFKRAINKSKKCWHPSASPTTCKVDSIGNIIVSAAHSLQNNEVLSQVAKEGIVTTYAVEAGEFKAKKIHKNAASIFWGFCNIHDAVFYPIEINPYSQTKEQNFLFAYRAFVVAAHKKIEVTHLVQFGLQSDNDIIETKKIFDDAIINCDYECIETRVIEMPTFYPMAVSGSFYLDFDFEGNSIPHSEGRIECIYVTLFPIINKTTLLISYFESDNALYGNIGPQLVQRNNLKSDISILLAAHVENIYYNPDYYQTFIESQQDKIEKVAFEAQIDLASINDNDEHTNIISITPSNYLSNPYEINLFGY